MKISKVMKTIVLATLILLLGTSAATAQDANPENIVVVNIDPSSITWAPLIGDVASMTLTITGPNGYYSHQDFGGQATISSNGLADGAYLYEVVLSPGYSSNLAADETSRGLGVFPIQPRTQSGGFTVLNGSFVSSGVEGGPNDVVHADDLIVQGSFCIGLDCINGESFGFDTIRLKENNTRIKFDDTSVGAFPANDWTIVANDSASGGTSFLGFEDVTGAKFPFKVIAGAPTDSLFVSSSGNVGVGTGAPVLDIHIATSDTPGVRLEQNGSGGFVPQTWDIAGNEANFFIRDITGGSRLPFRIRPGAPTSSIDIAASGNVGIGTASPAYDLDVANTGAQANLAVRQTDGATLKFVANATQGTIGTENNFPVDFLVNGASKMTLNTNGNLGIGTTSPDYHLQIERTGVNTTIAVTRVDGGITGAITKLQSNTNKGFIGTENDFPLGFLVNNVNKMTLATNGNLTILGSANATAFNVSSDRNIKENFLAINQESVLERLASLPISTWNFIDDDSNALHMGPMAQDFHAAFGLGEDDKHISTLDADGVAFAAIQELNKRNEALNSENAILRNQVDELAERVSALETGELLGGQSGNLLIVLLVCLNLGMISWMVWSTRRGSVTEITRKK
jgi:hypothetical protein